MALTPPNPRNTRLRRLGRRTLAWAVGLTLGWVAAGHAPVWLTFADPGPAAKAARPQMPPAPMLEAAPEALHEHDPPADHADGPSHE